MHSPFLETALCVCVCMCACARAPVRMYVCKRVRVCKREGGKERETEGGKDRGREGGRETDRHRYGGRGRAEKEKGGRGGQVIGAGRGKARRKDRNLT